jgi:hypothetical protein
MALDFSKLTSVVKSVADLAASHASLSALAADAKDIEAKALAKVDSIIADVEAKAQAEVDSIVASIEAALGHVVPVTHAEAVGLTAVATALNTPVAPAAPEVPVSPTPPAAPAEPAPVADAPVPPVAVGVVAPPIPQTVEEYNRMRAEGLIT